MDEAYNKHSRRNKSTTNFTYSSMAPLSSRISSIDSEYYTDGFPFHQTNTTFSGTHTARLPRSHTHFSAPTSPGLTSDNGLSMTPTRRPVLVSKSKSHIDIPAGNTANMSAYRNPRRTLRRPAPLERLDSDWMPHAALVLSESANELNGQSWMMSSPNDSFATAPSPRLWEHHYELEETKRKEQQRAEYARAAELRALARRSSRPNSTRTSPVGSRHGSAFPSRVPSRVSFAALSVVEDEKMGYVEKRGKVEVLRPQDCPGPDFVDEDDKLEAEVAFREYHGLTQLPQDDELAIRKLVREGTSPKSWIATVMGWKRNPENEVEEEDEEEEDIQGRIIEERRTIQRHFEGVSNVPEEQMPPPKADEGGWSDAAWLLSLVSKVIL